jgi:predicted nucleotidyltransferase
VRENIYVRSYVDPVFSAEETLPEALESELSDIFESRSLSIVLFGSYARGDQTPDSDVDVIAVAHDVDTKARIEHDLPSIASTFRRRWGAHLSLVTYDPAEASAVKKRAPALYESLLQDGIRVSGRAVTEWGSLGTK